MNETEELRTAAKLMRERGHAATGGRWHHMCMGSEGCAVINDGHLRERRHVAFSGRKEWKADHADAQYIASMPPPVALAVADLLDEVAADRHPELPAWGECAALTVARAYLGPSNESERR